MTNHERFFDQTLNLIEFGHLQTALPMLIGKLYSAHGDQRNWPETRSALLRHPLHSVLLEDPYIAHCVKRPRGYPGDAALIDLIYDQRPPRTISDRAQKLFDISTSFQTSEAVRQRRHYAAERLAGAWREKKRICALACGHLREADELIGLDVSTIVAVDQDPLSLDVVRANHGATMRIEEANVLHFLRKAARRGEQFDLIYTLGLTDYFDTRAMSLLHRLMKDCLAPGGEIMLANFLPGHLAIGWMDAVMDWHLVYRDEADLHRHAANIGMTAKTFRDPTGTIAFCEMIHHPAVASPTRPSSALNASRKSPATPE